MKTRITQFITAVAFGFLVAAPVAALVAPAAVPVSAQSIGGTAASKNCEKRLLGIPSWYRGLVDKTSDCSLKSPNDFGENGLSKYIWRIALNIIEMALVIIAYIAGFFILLGGFQFMTGGSNPSAIEKGRKSIFNAVIGLIIAMGSIAVVNTLFGIITGTMTDEGVPAMTGPQLLTSVLNLVYFLAGTISVIMIIVSGVMYTTSSGDPGRVTKAKNMIVYAIAGLVVVLTAFIITNFVIGRFN